MFRQGDVLIVPASEIPAAAVPVKRVHRAVVLAEGEVTGHAHRIIAEGAELFEIEGLEDRFLRVLTEGGVDLVHEEHGIITLPVGDYVVRRQREYTPERNVQVLD